MRSAGVVSLAVFMSRITGLLRESVMARLFGAGLIYDAFMLGFRIPNLTRDLFAEGALSSAFVPTFTEYLTNARQGRSRAPGESGGDGADPDRGRRGVRRGHDFRARAGASAGAGLSPRCPENSNWR